MEGTRFLSAIDPRMRAALEWLDAFLSPYGITFRIVSGFRSFAEQSQLYAQGRTALEVQQRVKKRGQGGAVTDAPPGESAHNYGLAVDLDPDDADTPTIIQIAAAVGFGTVSWDPDHLEYPQWRSIASASRG